MRWDDWPPLHSFIGGRWQRPVKTHPCHASFLLELSHHGRWSPGGKGHGKGHFDESSPHFSIGGMWQGLIKIPFAVLPSWSLSAKVDRPLEGMGMVMPFWWVLTSSSPKYYSHNFSSLLGFLPSHFAWCLQAVQEGRALQAWQFPVRGNWQLQRSASFPCLPPACLAGGSGGGKGHLWHPSKDCSLGDYLSFLYGRTGPDQCNFS